MSLTSRILAWPGPPLAGDSAAAVSGPSSAPRPGWRSNLVWLNLFLLMHMGARSLLTMPSSGGAYENGLYGLSIATAVLGCVPGLTRGATRLAFVLVLLQLLHSLPDSANHVFLETVLFFLFALLDPGHPAEGSGEGEAQLLMRGLRWYVIVFFAYTGIQKVLYGAYFDGQFLAYMAATEERFTLLFEPLLPAAELERLQAFNEAALPDGRYQVATDAGPYRVDAPLFVALSNLVYLFEIVAPILLLFRRTRSAAALSIIAFVVLIELGAREITFGMLMVQLSLIFMQGPWIRRLFPAFALGYLYLLLAEGGGAGILPMFWYSPA